VDFPSANTHDLSDGFMPQDKTQAAVNFGDVLDRGRSLARNRSACVANFTSPEQSTRNRPILCPQNPDGAPPNRQIAQRRMVQFKGHIPRNNFPNVREQRIVRAAERGVSTSDKAVT
jgi:hypothetical protein